MYWSVYLFIYLFSSLSIENETQSFRINYVHQNVNMLISRIVDRQCFTMIVNNDHITVMAICWIDMAQHRFLKRWSNRNLCTHLNL